MAFCNEVSVGQMPLGRKLRLVNAIGYTTGRLTGVAPMASCCHPPEKFLKMSSLPFALGNTCLFPWVVLHYWVILYLRLPFQEI